MTDVNLFLGRIVSERFPFSIQHEAAKQRLRELSQQVAGAAADVSPRAYSLDDLAEGLLRIANANMASVIRSVTIAKGANPADYVLVAFGGAAGQHACAVRELGIKQVLLHPQASVLSALGIGLADITRHRSCGMERPLDDAAIAYAATRLEELEKGASGEVCGEGVDEVSCVRSLDLSYRGADGCLTIAWPDDGDFANAFATAHSKRFGYTHVGRPINDRCRTRRSHRTHFTET